MGRRNSLSSRLGFFLIAIASAGGLGNLWRFPYVVSENGGGAFVLLYLFLVMIVGLPLLMAELMLGKSTGKSILAASRSLGHSLDGGGEIPKRRRYKNIGIAAVVLAAVVLAYYSVISGWVMHFALHFLLANFGRNAPLGENAMQSLQSNGFLQAGLASVHLLFCIFVVLKGVRDGLERFISWTIPLFAFLLLLLMVKSMQLPSAAQALRFLFYPDFAKLSFHSLSQAIGQVLFTLSLGFGTMVTFGSYMSDDETVTNSGVRVVVVDTFVSLMSGLLVFPIVLQASNVSGGSPGLLFQTLPSFLQEMPGGLLFGLAFFLCLYLAALGASIGLLEVLVANLVGHDQRRRSRTVWSVGGIVFVLSAILALAGGMMGDDIRNGTPLEHIDTLIINVALPILAGLFCVAFSFGFSSAESERLFVGDSKSLEAQFLFPYWRLALRFVIPGIIAFALLLHFSASLFGM